MEDDEIFRAFFEIGNEEMLESDEEVNPKKNIHVLDIEDELINDQLGVEEGDEPVIEEYEDTDDECDSIEALCNDLETLPFLVDTDSENESDSDESESSISDDGLEDSTSVQRDISKLKPWEKTLPEFVVGHLTHNPCGPKFPGGTKRRCWIGGKCKAKMPREVLQSTDGDVDGYAAYRRRLNLVQGDSETKMPTLWKRLARAKKSDKKSKNSKPPKKHTFTNEWVPGYNPALLMKYRCHINVEFCGSIKAINYLYKYIYKGTDQGYMKLKQFKEEKDEIYLHKYGRILSANESHYRIAGFKRGDLNPSVTRLGFFVPEKKSILLERNVVPSEANIKEQIENTPYWQWFARNKLEHEIMQEHQPIIGLTSPQSSVLLPLVKKLNKRLGYDVVETARHNGVWKIQRVKDSIYGKENENVPFAFELNYENFGKRYRFDNDKKVKKWVRRKKDEDVIIRLYMGYPGTEYFYLRKLLRSDKCIGPLAIENLLIHPENEEIKFSSYKEACVALQLVDSQKEYYHCMSEAQDMGFSRGKLLGLFSQMINVGDIANIGEIWNGVKPKENEVLDEIEQKYPDGYKHLMMHYPKKLLSEIKRDDPRFTYDYNTLPDEHKRQCEQFTLRMIKEILDRSGTDYPKELPKLVTNTIPPIFLYKYESF